MVGMRPNNECSSTPPLSLSEWSSRIHSHYSHNTAGNLFDNMPAQDHEVFEQIGGALYLGPLPVPRVMEKPPGDSPR